MDIASSTIYLCPECEKPIAKMNITSYWENSGSVTVYSDGERTGGDAGIQTVHFTPDFGKCPVCNALFFLRNLKIAGNDSEFEDYEYIDEPVFDDYLKAVKRKIAKTPDEEIEVRTKLWQALNDSIRDNRHQDRRDIDAERTFFLDNHAKLWEDNCKALLPLLEKKIEKCDDKDEICLISVTIAELNRNLGNFDACFDIIECLPETFEWLKLKYISRTASHDRLVFILIAPDEKIEKFQTEDIDLDDPDQTVKCWTEAIEKSEKKNRSFYYNRADAYFKKSEEDNKYLQSAFEDINNALVSAGGDEDDYYLLAKIYKKMGDDDKARWNLFKTKHLAALGKINDGLSLDIRAPKKKEGISGPLIAEEKASVHENYGDFLFTLFLPAADENDKPVEAEIFYSGGENALFRRKPDQFILFKSIKKDLRETIIEKKEAFVAEYKSKNTKENEKAPVRVYRVKIRPVFETLESVDSIIEDGYPLFTSLRARVCAAKVASAGIDTPITDIIGKEDCVNLAAVLAREENYQLLDKYFAEGLTVNERVSSVYKTWRPTPLFTVTTNKIFSFMEDAPKMIRYLAANGADPDMTSSEGDTPLGNLCYSNGLCDSMKALLEIGANPNCFTDNGSGSVKPLSFLLLPAEYDEESHKFTPINANTADKAKLLIDSGADVKYVDDSGFSALALTINFSEGEIRSRIIRMLLDKGAEILPAVKALKKDAENNFPPAAFALFELFSGLIEELNVKPDDNLARKYLEIAAGLDYEPAVNELNDQGYDDGKYDGEV